MLCVSTRACELCTRSNHASSHACSLDRTVLLVILPFSLVSLSGVPVDCVAWAVLLCLQEGGKASSNKPHSAHHALWGAWVGLPRTLFRDAPAHRTSSKAAPFGATMLP
jgi:hypothetical protein